MLGAPRSGTSLVARLLQRLGLFVGADLDPNAESLFFVRRNEWALRRAGGAWDRPMAAKSALEDDVFRKRLVEELSVDVGSRAFADFTGSRRQRLLGGHTPASAPWGWKDPRNTFLADVWVQVFGGATLIAVHRNGVDVAASLHRRTRAARRAGPPELAVPPARTRLKLAVRRKPLPPHVWGSTRCASLDGSFEVWSEYASETERVHQRHTGPKISIGFEDLLGDPHRHLAELARICGLEVDRQAIVDACRSVRPDRSLAFRADPELQSFHERVRNSETMVRLGYAEPPRQ